MIDVPSLPNIIVAADWAEISTLFGKKPFVSLSDIRAKLEAADVEEVEIWVEDILHEIRRRHSIAPEVHPIKVTAEGIERIKKTWRDAFAYAFMVLLSCNSFYKSTKLTESQWKKPAKLFEQLSTIALERYVAGKAINTGSPRIGTVPERFVPCLDFIAGCTNEPRGRIKTFSAWSQDEHVDIIAWRPFDERCNQVILLAQCTAGEGWRKKLGEISINTWQEYVDFATTPVRAFAFPHVCDNDDWYRVSKAAGVLLDRLRIASFVPASSDLKRELNDWSSKQLEGLPW